MSKRAERRLAVIPSDPLEAYTCKGSGIDSWLQRYYNPTAFFDRVYVLSPREPQERFEFGMHIIPTRGRDLPRRIRALGVDVVRAYGGYWPCDFACGHKVNGVPVVVSVHDRREAWLHQSIRRADVILCTSEVVKRLVLSRRPATDNVWVLPNRVDLRVMHSCPPAQYQDLKTTYPCPYGILHVGRKAPEKNLDTVIAALRILGRDYCLLAIGRGDVESYQELACRQGVREQVFLIDNVANAELARYYSWADCLCNPSRDEGFGIVFIEALACQTPVVTSDIAPMNEFITHGENGLLVQEYEDPHALAAMIRKACTNAELRRTLRANARASVARFERGRVDALEASYYRTVLARKSQGSFKVPLLRRTACSTAMLAERCIRGSVGRIAGRYGARRPRQSAEGACKVPLVHGGR